MIHVGAAPDKVPSPLVDQLAEGGVMVIPVGGEHQTQKFLRVSKVNGEVKEETLTYVRYVPLTALEYQIRE